MITHRQKTESHRRNILQKTNFVYLWDLTKKIQ